MLKSIELKNFRKHEDLALDLNQGIIALRGNNEAGKSSLIEAIAYALFGAKACRESLDNVVTYGRPVSSLLVRMVLEVDGIEYTVKRSKSGAELTYGQHSVTGQNEVTDFFERLFGAPASVASSLWFVNQNSIRGALQGGSKATSTLIESLADFGLVDRIVDLIQTNLSVGNTRPFEERLRQAEEFRAQLSPVEPPSEEHKQRVKDLTELHVAAQVGEAARQEASMLFDRDVLLPALQRKADYEVACQDLESSEGQIAAKKQELAALASAPEYDEKSHQDALAQLETAKRSASQAAAWDEAWRLVAGLPAVDGAPCWEGTDETYQQFVAETTAKGAALTQRRTELRGQKELAEQRLVHAKVCGMCGKDVSQLPEAVEKNAAATAEIANIKKELAAVEAEIAEVGQTAATIAKINKNAALVTRLVDRLSSTGLLAVDGNFVPARVTMATERPSAVSADELQQLQARAKGMEAAKAQAAQWKVRRSLLEEQLAGLEGKCAEAAQKVAALKYDPTVVESAQKRGLELTNDLVKAREFRAQAEQDLRAATEQLKTATTQWEAYQQGATLAESMVKAAQQELADVNFNNVLLKKVRASRPVIVDHLWRVVLSAVTFYFSQIRGVQSSVTRNDGAFLVDGRAVDGLSGSTLDSLGLAIRLALLKTFLPRCRFLILDEPAAACDDAREASMLGTVAASQFDQTILVTHSNVADAYANQLVIL